MKVNLTPAEYEMVCRVADYYGSTPAALAHDWITREASAQYLHLYVKAESGNGMLGIGRDPDQSQVPAPTPAGRAHG